MNILNWIYKPDNNLINIFPNIEEKSKNDKLKNNVLKNNGLRGDKSKIYLPNEIWKIILDYTYDEKKLKEEIEYVKIIRKNLEKMSWNSYVINQELEKQKIKNQIFNMSIYTFFLGFSYLLYLGLCKDFPGLKF